MNKCGVCGNDVAVQHKREPMTSEEAFVRCIMVGGFVIFSIVAGMTGVTVYSDYVTAQAIKDPTMKVNIKKYDGNGRVTEEITR